MRLKVVTRSGRELVAGGLAAGNTVAELKAAFHEASKQRKARARAGTVQQN